MARFTDQCSTLRLFSGVSRLIDYRSRQTKELPGICKLVPSCSHPRIKSPGSRAMRIKKIIILKLPQHRQHNVQLKATSISNMPRSGKCANSSIKCPWCEISSSRLDSYHRQTRNWVAICIRDLSPGMNVLISEKLPLDMSLVWAIKPRG